MVSRIWPWLALLLLLPLPGYAAGVEVQLETPESVLGQPVGLTIRVEDPPLPLARLDLAPLRADFVVQDLVYSGHVRQQAGRGIAVAELRLRLFPRRAGALTVPALRLGERSSAPLDLTVRPEGPPGSRVRVRSGATPGQGWVRQALHVYVDILDDGGGVSARPAALRPPAAHARFLGETRWREVREGVDYNVLRLSWVVLPLRAGAQELDFPMLEVRSRQRAGHKLMYPVPPLRLSARPLPSYVPVHLPVARLRIEQGPLPEVLARDRPYTWTFMIQGQGLSQEGVHRLLAPALGRAAGLRFYPPDYRIEESLQEAGPQQTLHVSLPFVPLAAGSVQLPDLHLPYWDPASGRLEAAVLPGPRSRVSSPLLRALGWGAAGLLLAVLAAVAGRWALRNARGRSRRRRCLQALQTAGAPGELRAALLTWAGGDGTAPLTLRQWAGGAGSVDARVAEAIEELERRCYGPPNHQTQALASLAAKLAALVRGQAASRRSTGRRAG